MQSRCAPAIKTMVLQEPSDQRIGRLKVFAMGIDFSGFSLQGEIP